MCVLHVLEWKATILLHVKLLALGLKTFRMLVPRQYTWICHLDSKNTFYLVLITLLHGKQLSIDYFVQPKSDPT